jgi:hypothetical protein
MRLHRKPAAFAALVLICCGLAACGQQNRDWRAAAIADAEDQIRADVNDPAAKFSDVQVTGNSSTGQTCGRVSAKLSTGGDEEGRFIVYIDGSVSPYVENGMGAHPMTHEQFEFAWQNDCIKEGYKS